MDTKPKITARVVAVQDDLVTIESITTENGSHPLTKNEVIYILPSRLADDGRQEYLKAEVLRISGNRADAQVYESTSGVGVGDSVVQTDELLSVELGPGLLGTVYDGLQNPLNELSNQYGTFLPRGVDLSALDHSRKWLFNPSVKAGDIVRAGDELGWVAESRFNHLIMAPFDLLGPWKISWIQKGSFTVEENVLEIVPVSDEVNSVQAPRLIGLKQRWPIRIPIGKSLIQRSQAERGYPTHPLVTTIRLIDTFFPIAKGGTACIPGPFGAGKTVLQGLISRYSDVDIVIVVACGERAGEVVETIREFPNLQDPKTGGTLMERTIIICNTSSMPVAAREASIYTGITLGEYYQSMGLDVLLIADSTSRWAQAMRETSGRLEEIPGEEAFPAYLDSSIKSVYERAGILTTMNTEKSRSGSLTMIGTVSPAGGNFEEPVTQSTLSTVKTFLGLSSDRAYRRFYPAIDPLISWSRYVPQLKDWYVNNMGEDWLPRINKLKQILTKGEDVRSMMQVAGEEGITVDDFILHQRAEFIDRIFLQQDAFDSVDVSVPLERQNALLNLIDEICVYDLKCSDKTEIREWFTELTNIVKNLNYSKMNDVGYKNYISKIKEMMK
ncbi:V-type ATP synthase subunit A [Sessilibacter corallicola]|uniref:V-type ATP synthase subunit A n=1 Tax=Sessilibacter corallicola TaxID=2904075 RepID=UPI001E4C79DE|nr:V-type ATP synthase subunit A [Sessilibacter corallicola]MCE2029092.1 V-type ATP synthase subunit A [Sessilibacter corallicola]